MFILRVAVVSCVSLDPDMISQMDKPWPVDHHPRLNVDILPVGSEEKPIFDVDKRIPESFFLHGTTSLLETVLSIIPFISSQFLSLEYISASSRAAMEAFALFPSFKKKEILSARVRC